MTLAEKQPSTPSVSVARLLDGEAPIPANCPLAVRDYLDHIVVGGWPFLVGADHRAARIYLDGYLDVIANRDIDEVSGGRRNPHLVRRFLHSYAQMTAQTAHLTTIMNRARVDHDAQDDLPSRQTATTYLDALRRMVIIDEVPAWDPSVRSSKRLTTLPKRMLADVSLSASLLGMSATRMLNDLATTGFLFEALVAHDLRIYAEAAGASCFHYREAEGRLEVDYVIETRSGDWMGVEVKLGDSEIDKAASSLRRLAGRVPRAPVALAVITGTSLAYTRDDGVHVIPLGLLGP